ncbi:hypothetical protein [Streptomyces sp. NPDC088847]|uniref:hypothetical protein n=1 Tax=Streptomyces sp. NPDC088847 TaxID=3365909 RepID=UPI0038148BBD
MEYESADQQHQRLMHLKNLHNERWNEYVSHLSWGESPVMVQNSAEMSRGQEKGTRKEHSWQSREIVDRLPMSPPQDSHVRPAISLQDMNRLEVLYFVHENSSRWNFDRETLVKVLAQATNIPRVAVSKHLSHVDSRGDANQNNNAVMTAEYYRKSDPEGVGRDQVRNLRNYEAKIDHAARECGVFGAKTDGRKAYAPHRPGMVGPHEYRPGVPAASMATAATVYPVSQMDLRPYSESYSNYVGRPQHGANYNPQGAGAAPGR